MKAPVVLALMAGFVMTGVSLVQAENCAKTVRKAQDNLRKEVLRHGQFSPQARYRRHQLEVVRQRCGQMENFQDREGDRDRDRNRNQRQDGDHR
jgi:hypothetical protein